MRSTASILAGLAVFLVAQATTADIPVTYDVDQKAVKSGLAVGRTAGAVAAVST